MPSCSIHRTLNLPLKAWWLACMVLPTFPCTQGKVRVCMLLAWHTCVRVSDVYRWCEEIRGTRTRTCAHTHSRTRTFSRPSLFLPVRFSPRLREVRNTWSNPRTVSYIFLKSDCLLHTTLPLTLTLTLDWSLSHTHTLSHTSWFTLRRNW